MNKKLLFYFSIIALAIGLYFFFLKKHAPVIALLETKPLDVVAMKDSVVIAISYFDAHGDIGMEDLPSLFVHDSRDCKLNLGFPVPTLLPDSLHGSVSGKLFAVIRFVPLLHNKTEDTFHYYIHLKDRGNHFSNVLASPTIHLHQ